MKKKICIILGTVLFSICGIAYCANGPWPVEFELTVTDGEGNPVSEADVVIGSTIYQNWEDRKTERTEGKTDSDGKYSVNIKTAYTFSGRVKKEGYYDKGIPSVYYQREIEQQKKARGMPITVKRELIMRKVLNPVPLLVRFDPVLIKAVDEKLGFDLEKMDWVSPHGKGMNADFYMEQNGYWKDEGYSAKLSISFPNEGDGIFAFDPEKDEWRFAPEAGYQSKKEWKIERVRKNLGTSDEIRTDINEFKNEHKDYFLRVRTVVDTNGRVIKANYARIKRDQMIEPFQVWSGRSEQRFGQLNLSFSFNPETNNRSLERK